MMRIDFVLTSLVVVAAPGPGAMLTLAAGVSRGMRAALVTAAGCTLGIVPHLLLAVTGLAALMRTASWSFDLLRIAGVSYLAYLALQAWRDRGTLALQDAGGARSDLQVVRHAVLVNLLNPKLSMFFIAFLPQFVAPGDEHPAYTMMRLSLGFMAMTFGVFVLYGAFAAKARGQVLARPRVSRWLRRGVAAAFIGLAGKLAFVHR